MSGLFGLPVWTYAFFAPGAYFIMLGLYLLIYGFIDWNVRAKGRGIENLIIGIVCGLLALTGLLIASKLR